MLDFGACLPRIRFQGGTSTDVSRFSGKFEHIFESITAGILINSPQLDINTVRVLLCCHIQPHLISVPQVAAGGGSCLAFKNGLLTVGPESAGADPGPACYR